MTEFKHSYQIPLMSQADAATLIEEKINEVTLRYPGSAGGLSQAGKRLAYVVKNKPVYERYMAPFNFHWAPPQSGAAEILLTGTFTRESQESQRLTFEGTLTIRVTHYVPKDEL